MWKEFKEFAIKGNVMDLAVAVVIGAAFGKIVSSLVENIITPLIGILTGGINITDRLIYNVGDATIKLGTFIQTIIDFVIIAFAIFLFVRVLNKFKQPKEQTPVAPPIDKKEELLKEIRDLLKKEQA